VQLESLAQRSHRYTFRGFELDPQTGELRDKQRLTVLQQQPAEILLAMLERPGGLITREELVRRLWPTGTFVDFDRSLNKAVNKLREALQDSAENPRFIETLARRGYRFIAPVEAEISEAPRSTEIRSGASISSTIPSGQVAPRGYGTRTKVVASALVVAVGLLLTLSLSRVRERLLARLRPPHIQSLAVLPLVNLSTDVGQDFFADGVTEELTTDLGKISALRVISRTSVMQYKGSKKSLHEIAKELNVDAVGEGTVTGSGSHLRITANLVQASPEKHLWAERYESEVGDALTVQGEIAQAVAREIQVQLTPQEQILLTVARPVDPEAHDLYLKGLYIRRDAESAESSEKAIQYFRQAIEKDPNYAAAYAELAHVYAVWIPGMNRGPRDLMPEAKRFAVKALQLDSTLAAAHSVLGGIALFYDWNWSAAEEEYKQTMALNPNNVGAHEWHSRGLVTQGRTEEAIAEAKRTIALSPSPLSWDYPIWVFVLAHRFDLASERAHQLLEVAPNWVWAHFMMAQVLEQQGQFEEAAQEFLKADELFGTDSKKVAQLKEAMTKSGAQGYWRRTLENYRESAKLNYVPSVLVAQACVRVGDKECAFEWLERGFEERDDLIIDLRVEPVFDNLRSDPRFQDLVHRVGIPQ
jgi:TolB-like protein/DNA-binding winged helix-turn-helix (wHTH) protein/Tfp pilus assembly protein PilF